MQTASRLLIIMSVFLAACATALAADKPAAKPAESYRLCSDADLLAAGGTWKLMMLTETPALKEAAAYKQSPHQYLAFYPDHQYASLASDHEIKTPAEVRKMMSSSQQGKPPLKYTLDTKSQLDLYHDKAIEYSYRCVTMNDNVPGYRKGDIALTGYTREGSQLFKLYRHF